MFAAVKERMDRFAEWTAAKQTWIFMRLVYFTAVPFAYLYLRGTSSLHHEMTGYFKEPNHKSNRLERHRKQY